MSDWDSHDWSSSQSASASRGFHSVYDGARSVGPAASSSRPTDCIDPRDLASDSDSDGEGEGEADMPYTHTETMHHAHQPTQHHTRINETENAIEHDTVDDTNGDSRDTDVSQSPSEYDSESAAVIATDPHHTSERHESTSVDHQLMGEPSIDDETQTNPHTDLHHVDASQPHTDAHQAHQQQSHAPPPLALPSDSPSNGIGGFAVFSPVDSADLADADSTSSDGRVSLESNRIATETDVTDEESQPSASPDTIEPSPLETTVPTNDPVPSPSPSPCISTPSVSTSPPVSFAGLIPPACLASSSFYARHQTALSAIDDLSDALDADLAALESAAAEEERIFQEECAQITQSDQRVKEALLALEEDKGRMHARESDLRHLVDDDVTELSRLDSRLSSLADLHGSLLVSGRERLIRRYTDAQPYIVMMRHNEGSKRGAHQVYIKEERRRMRRERRQRGEENIHQSSSEDELEQIDEKETTALSYPIPSLDSDLVGLDLSLPLSSLPRRIGFFDSRRDGPFGSPRLVLPVTVFDTLCSHLGVKDLLALSSVSRDWSHCLDRHARAWKQLLRRVSQVEVRIKKEHEKTKLARKRQSQMRAQPPVNNNIQHATTPPLPIKQPALTQPHTSPPPTTASTPVQSPLATPSSSPPLHRPDALSSSVSSTSTGGGLLSGLVRRFRVGSISAKAGAGADQANGVVHATTNVEDGHGANAQVISQDENGDHPMHLHYTLTIDMAGRDSAVLVVTAAVARSSGDGLACVCDLPPDRTNGGHVSLHLCSLRRSSFHDDDLEFCRQVISLQANLTQIRSEREKLLGQIEADEGRKRSYTIINDRLASERQQAELELDRLKQQSDSDSITRDFLSQQVDTLSSTLETERARTVQLRVDCDATLSSASRFASELAAEIDQQRQHHATLKQQKKQLTKEVKSMQSEIEREREEKERIKQEYIELLDAIAKLKGHNRIDHHDTHDLDHAS